MNNEASSRTGNGVLFLADRLLRYMAPVNPRDRRKSTPTLPPMTPANVPMFLCGFACGWLEIGMCQRSASGIYVCGPTGREYSAGGAVKFPC